MGAAGAAHVMQLLVSAIAFALERFPVLHPDLCHTARLLHGQDGGCKKRAFPMTLFSHISDASVDATCCDQNRMGNQAGKSLPFVPVREAAAGAGGYFLWTVHDGCAPEAKSATLAGKQPPSVTIFSLRKAEASPVQLQLARNALRRLKTIRHPHIVKCMAGEETETDIVIVTEHVQHLTAWLTSEQAMEGAGEADQMAPPGVQWGLHSIFTAIAFLNEECNLVHGALRPEAILVTDSGEWKLGGFELCDGVEGDPLWQAQVSAVTSPGHDSWLAPERAGRGGESGGRERPWSADVWSLGVLLYAFATKTIPELQSGGFPRSRDALAVPDRLPRQLQAVLQRMLAPQLVRRPKPSQARKGAASTFFTSSLLSTLDFLEHLPLKEPPEKRQFFERLPSLLPAIPRSLRTRKVLPLLMQAVEFGAAGGGSTVVLAPILDIGKDLPPAEYEREVVPCVVRLFASPDRATRVQLLQHLPSFLPHLDDDTINGSVWTHTLEGFHDSAPVLREATLKAVVDFAPRLKLDHKRNSLVQHVRYLLRDPEPALRVNAAVALGRIAEHLEADTRESLLLAPLLATLRDGFAPSRAAALRALTHVVALPRGRGAEGARVERPDDESVSPASLASHVLPTVAPLAVDPVPMVRTTAVAFLRRATDILEQASERRTAEQEREEEEERRRKARQQQAAAKEGAAPTGIGSEPAPGSAGGILPDRARTVFSSALNWAVSSWSQRPEDAVTGTVDRAAAPAEAGTASAAPSPAPGPPTATATAAGGGGGGGMRLKRTPPASGGAGRDVFSLAAGGGGGGGWEDEDDLDLGEAEPAAAPVPPVVQSVPARPARAMQLRPAATTTTPAMGGAGRVQVGGAAGGSRVGPPQAGGWDWDELDIAAETTHPPSAAPAPSPAPSAAVGRGRGRGRGRGGGMQLRTKESKPAALGPTLGAEKIDNPADFEGWGFDDDW